MNDGSILNNQEDSRRVLKALHRPCLFLDYSFLLITLRDYARTTMYCSSGMNGRIGE